MLGWPRTDSELKQDFSDRTVIQELDSQRSITEALTEPQCYGRNVPSFHSISLVLRYIAEQGSAIEPLSETLSSADFCSGRNGYDGLCGL
jgi:hypothetical protein